MPDRPGEVAPDELGGHGLGSPGPDQGYALILAERLAGTLHLSEGEHEKDALAVAAALGMKRASTFGRAPILADLRIGADVWGLRRSDTPDDLVDLRRELFDEAHHPHSYTKLRGIVDATPAEFLHRPIADIEADLADDPRAGLSLPVA